MAVRDDQFHPAQATPGERTQKVGPGRLHLAGAGCHTKHLSPAVGVDRHRDRRGDGADAPGLADFDLSGIKPEIRPLALDRPVEEGADALIEFGAEPADLAFADAGRAHGLLPGPSTAWVDTPRT